MATITANHCTTMLLLDFTPRSSNSDTSGWCLTQTANLKYQILTNSGWDSTINSTVKSCSNNIAGGIHSCSFDHNWSARCFWMSSTIDYRQALHLLKTHHQMEMQILVYQFKLGQAKSAIIWHIMSVMKTSDITYRLSSKTQHAII